MLLVPKTDLAALQLDWAAHQRPLETSANEKAWNPMGCVRFAISPTPRKTKHRDRSASPVLSVTLRRVCIVSGERDDRDCVWLRVES